MARPINVDTATSLPFDLAPLQLVRGAAVLITDLHGTVLWRSQVAAALLGPPADPGCAVASILELSDATWGRLCSATASGSSTTNSELLPDAAASTSNAVDGPQLRVVRVLASSDRLVDVLACRIGDSIVLTLLDCTQLRRAESDLVEVRARLAESERTRARLNDLRAELASDQVAERTGQTMIGESAQLRLVRDRVSKVAKSNTTVLINGETGSGKELVSRSLHALSPRRQQAFVALNCAAMPESLIESELFGHERGAFTGADRRKLGKFELADGGTLFLDEVAELPLTAQAKLLRVLQERTIERVGGTEPVKVDVRLVAATHRDLARQVERGRFREDLYYRLAVFTITVPPLRDRKEDLRALVEHLHEHVARRMAKPVLPLNDRCLRRLMAYSWPGNVRELANAVERATLLCEGAELEIDLPQGPLIGLGDGSQANRSGTFGSGTAASGSAGSGADSDSNSGGGASDILLDLSLEQLQRLQIIHALERCGYRVFGEDGAAARMEINPRTLLSRMDKFGIPRPRTARAMGS